MNFLITTLLFVTITITTSSNMDYTFQKTRNQYLRFYVATKKSQTKHLVHEIHNFAIKTKEKSEKMYNSALSKYHDAHIAYYSLSQENRELIDQIINMHF
jgi:hypothetical protein